MRPRFFIKRRFPLFGRHLKRGAQLSQYQNDSISTKFAVVHFFLRKMHTLLHEKQRYPDNNNGLNLGVLVEYNLPLISMI
jgi:hypothetical protein